MSVRVCIAEGEAREGAFGVRRKVFVEEQQCPPEEEWDEYDAVATHFAALDDEGRAIGSARLVCHGEAGKVGRMAVLREWRGQGVGQALLEATLEEARRLGLKWVYLHAQTHAEGFYSRFGFQPEGELFQEAGIEHVRMSRRLE